MADANTYIYSHAANPTLWYVFPLKKQSTKRQPATFSWSNKSLIAKFIIINIKSFFFYTFNSCLKLTIKNAFQSAIKLLKQYFVSNIVK